MKGGGYFGTEQPKENIHNPSMLLRMSHRLNLRPNERAERRLRWLIFLNALLSLRGSRGFCFGRNIKWTGSPLLSPAGSHFRPGFGEGYANACVPLRAAAAGSTRAGLLTEGSELQYSATAALLLCLSSLLSPLPVSLSRVSGKVGRMVSEQQMFRLQRCLPANNWSQCSRETLWDSARKTSNTSQPPDSKAQLTLLPPSLHSFCFLHTFSVLFHFTALSASVFVNLCSAT